MTVTRKLNLDVPICSAEARTFGRVRRLRTTLVTSWPRRSSAAVQLLIPGRAANQAGCTVLFSDDLEAARELDGLRVVTHSHAS
jgi:hypothetical protein